MTREATRLLVNKLLASRTDQQRRQAAVEMHRAIHGTEPTDEDLCKLEQLVANYSKTDSRVCDS